jgi:DNA-directed RNA polymerase, mitochondrial
MQESHMSFVRTKTNLMDMGKGTGLRSVQRVFLQWYEPFLEEIHEEIELIKSKNTADGRSVYGPLLMLLAPEKLAIITINTVMNSILSAHNRGSTVANTAIDVADAVHTEFLTVMKLGGPRAAGLGRGAGSTAAPGGAAPEKKFVKPSDWRTEMVRQLLEGGSMTKGILMRIKRLMEAEEWPKDVKLKLGSALIALLLQTAKFEPSRKMAQSHGLTEGSYPALCHTSAFLPAKQKRVGLIMLHPALYESFLTDGSSFVELSAMLIKYLPMVVPPQPWDHRSASSSPYYSLQANLVRSTSKVQQKAVRLCTMPAVQESLNFINATPWRINAPIYQVIAAAVEQGLDLGEIPSDSNLPMPDESLAWEEPRVPYVFGPGNYAVPTREETVALEEAMAAIERGERVFNAAAYKRLCSQVAQKNAELHSMRCDLKLKLWVAKKFLGEERIYFPHNLDFRGRTYPIPPNLNHLGSDLCRGMLVFAQGKPLGPRGLDWLKVHLANLCGHNKVSRDDRIAWVDARLDDVLDSARRPLEGHRWWATAENPFQALATCVEILAAMECPEGPAAYVSHLPVHQDGSCNGLQHYAALGRDHEGGAAVNLVKNSTGRPADVYSEVLKIVERHVATHAQYAEDDPDETRAHQGQMARLVKPYVSRKVIKQTVMTSVYGVTRVGARLQVERQLEGLLYGDDARSPEQDAELFQASRYVSNLALDSLSEMFTAARLIMDWLARCAQLVATVDRQSMSWLTPLGLPVMQPYRKNSKHLVKTMLQRVVLTMEDENLPVSSARQRSAFPPNFVHSLDATHMMLTSLQMKELGLTFAAVHDSYWTHACDTPVLAEALRSAFIELYSLPILEDLRESLQKRHSGIKFPELPERGSLDIESVWESPYFFH